MIIKTCFIRASEIVRGIFIAGSFFFIASIYASANSASAQKEVGIAAIVGDSAISNVDLQERMKIAMFASNLPAGKGFEEKIMPQVLHNLIDERLYMKEAEKLGVEVTADELNTVVADIEKRNNIRPGKFKDFMKFNGISETSMMDQIKSQLTWNKVIARKIRPQISVTDKEIDEKLENISKQSGAEEVNISEILLTADNSEEAKKVKEVADKLVKLLGNGGDFMKIAKQFSKASSAQNGGNIGWIRPGQIPDEAATIIKSLKKGDVSDPIAVPEGFGYTIIKLNARRAIASIGQEDSQIGLRQALATLAKDSSENDRKKLEETIQKKQATVKTCNDFAKFAKDIGSSVDPQMVMTKISDLSPDVSSKVSHLKVGELSKPIAVESGFNIYMVCEKTDAPSTVELKNKIREGLSMRKLESQANRYLRDLRRGAFIEVRI